MVMMTQARRALGGGGELEQILAEYKLRQRGTVEVRKEGLMNTLNT